jgi:membrane-associated phospholipid phosphatase
MSIYKPFLPRRVLCSLACAVVFLILPTLALHGQEVSAPSEPASDAPEPSEPIASSPAQRDVSLSLLPANFLHDQERMWAFPYQFAKGQYWVPTIAVAAGTFALLSTDPSDDPYFAHTRVFRGFDHVFGSKVTGMETIAIPSAIYAIGLASGDSYMQKTALFAAEAVADSEVIRAVMNSVTTRWRPADITPPRNYVDTFFHSKSRIGSSFPSGHTIAAFTVATIIARRYRNHRWVPWAAYGLAGTIGFSRITLRAHFPSDVFLGGALGYAIARYDVLRDY